MERFLTLLLIFCLVLYGVSIALRKERQMIEGISERKLKEFEDAIR